MNEQLQKELALWLASLREAAQHGAGFALDQAPLIVREKVLYGRISETLWVLLGIAAVAFCARLARAQWAVYEESRQHKGYADMWIELPGAGTSTAAMFGCMAFGLWTLCSIDTAAQAWFAPRLYVIEWLAGLMK